MRSVQLLRDMAKPAAILETVAQHGEECLSKARAYPGEHRPFQLGDARETRRVASVNGRIIDTMKPATIRGQIGITAARQWAPAFV